MTVRKVNAKFFKPISDEHVDNFNDDALDLQQQDAQAAMDNFKVVVADDDIKMEVRRRNGNTVALLVRS